jgi:hypothetical protein
MEANHRIRLGVYSSKTVYGEISSQMKAALVNHQKMEVQILMYSPELAARIENNPDLAKDVADGTKKWKRLYAEAKKEAKGKKDRRKPKLEIRYLYQEEMAAFHRVLLVDDRKWVLNVHRPGIERGVEGIVYQGSCEYRPTNLYNLLDHYWRAAWESGVDPSLPKRALHHLRRYQHLMIILGALFLAGYCYKHPEYEFLRIRNEWWGGALLGLIVAEVYNNGSNIIQDVLELLNSIIDALHRLIARPSA